MRPKKTITILMLVLILLMMVYSIQATPTVTKGDRTYLGGLVFYNVPEEAFQASVEQDKPVMMYFWAIWCQFCAKVHSEVFPDAEVSQILNDEFILVAIDLDVDKKTPSQFNVLYPPYFIFFTPTGEIIEIISGYLPVENFLPVLEDINSKYNGD